MVFNQRSLALFPMVDTKFQMKPRVRCAMRPIRGKGGGVARLPHPTRNAAMSAIEWILFPSNPSPQG